MHAAISKLVASACALALRYAVCQPLVQQAVGFALPFIYTWLH